MAAGQDIAQLLDAYRQGDPTALEALIPLVYDDLRKIAKRSLRQMGDLTINTTDLVHETYLKLSAQRVLSAEDRGHFLAICARAMRQFVLNHVRNRATEKRGSGLQLLNLDDVELPHETDIEHILFVDEALKKLALIDLDLVRVFECRFFAGLSDEETSQALGRPLRSIQRDWMKARGWIRELMTSVH
jgi:RNA polymerase sigma factor (TIGR02999 family)